MRSSTHWFALALLGFLPGCLLAAVAVGAGAAGAVLYTANGAQADYRADLDTTWRAAIRALQAYGYPIADDAPHGQTDGVLDVDDARVHVASHAGGITRVEVRIGTFHTDDHKRRAKLILESIGKELAS